ncbi:MAG: hypothetical protein ACOZNI_27145 [Myxococcota bacterium]
MKETGFAEFDRVRRVIDQMTSQHAYLAESFAGKRQMLDLTGLLTGAIGLTLVFADIAGGPVAKLFISIGIRPIYGVALLTIVNFAVGPVSSLLQLGVKEGQHRHAVAVLSKMRLAAKRIAATEPVDHGEVVAFLQEWESVGESIASLPEAEFNRAKSWHLYKVELSKRLSDHPGAWALPVATAIRIGRTWSAVRSWRGAQDQR